MKYIEKSLGENQMKISKLPEWKPFESLTDKQSIDLYEEALNDMLKTGEILPDEEFIGLARKAITNAREKLDKENVR